jgi:hypothetical protein
LFGVALGSHHAQALVYVVFELFECDKDHREIIDAVAPSCDLNNLVADHAADLVQGRWLHPWDAEVSRALEGGDVPNDLVYLIVLQFVVNSVRSDYDVVKGLRSIGLSDDLRQASDTVLNAAVGRDLGLSVAKRSADT